MNPLRVFNNFFFNVAYTYDKVFDYSDQCVFAGISALSIIQWTNLIVILKFFRILKPRDEKAVIIIALVLIPITLNIIRFRKRDGYEKMLNTWETERVIKKQLINTISILYGILSFALLGIDMYFD